MKTKREIIDETVAFYSEDINRRAIVGGNCLYKAANGNKCAFARVALDEVDLTPYEGKTVLGISEKLNNAQSVHESQDLSVDSIVKPEYHGHTAAFWRDVQFIHDQPNFWFSGGLTPSGKEYVSELKSKYS